MNAGPTGGKSKLLRGGVAMTPEGLSAGLAGLCQAFNVRNQTTKGEKEVCKPVRQVPPFPLPPQISGSRGSCDL